MKLLLDACVWGKARGELAAAGHDVVWAGDWPDDPGDEAILNRAYAEGRVLVTLDKDFGELAVLRGLSHPTIIRLVSISATRQASVCLHILSHYREDVERAALITAEPGRVRIRRAEM